MDSSINGGDLKVPLMTSDIDNNADELDEERGQGDTTSRGNALHSNKPKHAIGFGALVFLIYYNIGVPFGDEQVSSYVLAPWFSSVVCSDWTDRQ